MTMGSDSKRGAVRGGFKERLAGTLAGWLIRIVGATLRMEVVDRCGLSERGKVEGPIIWCMWHNRVFVLPSARNRFCKWRKGVVLTSASKDGAILAAAMKVFGVEVARGSSSRRGATALKEMIKATKGGADTGVTPDGPRGPCYVLQPGIIKLAQATRTPIVPVHVEFGKVWRLNSWDRFHIPWPFSKVTITVDEMLVVPRNLDEDAFAAHCRKLEAVMRSGVQDFEESSDGDH